MNRALDTAKLIAGYLASGLFGWFLLPYLWAWQQGEAATPANVAHERLIGVCFYGAIGLLVGGASVYEWVREQYGLERNRGVKRKPPRAKSRTRPFFGEETPTGLGPGARLTARQTRFLRLGVAAAVLAFVFPPFHFRGSGGHSTGFHFIFHPGYSTGDVDVTLLFIEMAIIGAATWAALQTQKH